MMSRIIFTEMTDQEASRTQNLIEYSVWSNNVSRP